MGGYNTLGEFYFEDTAVIRSVEAGRVVFDGDGGAERIVEFDAADGTPLLEAEQQVGVQRFAPGRSEFQGLTEGEPDGKPVVSLDDENGALLLGIVTDQLAPLDQIRHEVVGTCREPRSQLDTNDVALLINSEDGEVRVQSGETAQVRFGGFPYFLKVLMAFENSETLVSLVFMMRTAESPDGG